MTKDNLHGHRTLAGDRHVPKGTKRVSAVGASGWLTPRLQNYIANRALPIQQQILLVDHTGRLHGVE